MAGVAGRLHDDVVERGRLTPGAGDDGRGYATNAFTEVVEDVDGRNGGGPSEDVGARRPIQLGGQTGRI